MEAALRTLAEPTAGLPYRLISDAVWVVRWSARPTSLGCYRNKLSLLTARMPPAKWRRLRSLARRRPGGSMDLTVDTTRKFSTGRVSHTARFFMGGRACRLAYVTAPVSNPPNNFH